jgi:hypothetical protein
METHGAASLRWRGLVAAAAAWLLASCGADQMAGIQGTGAPVASSVTVVGPIGSFGSIIIDGVEYATSGAQVTLDDQPGTEAQLRVGQIVAIRGTINDAGTAGTATQVAFTGDLRGPAKQIDLENGTFVVLGQTVRVTDATLFDDNLQPADLTALQADAMVEVSGFANAAGEIAASRVDLTSVTTLQVRGTVQALDTTAHTFRINTLTVDYSGIAPSGTLANGATVLVQGNSFSQSNALVATRVQVFAGLGAAANDRGQIEGVITAFTSNADFVVNGQRVTTDGSTQFVLQGVTLGVNVPVKVRGTFNASGVLAASKVEAKQNSLSLVRGLVDSVSASGNTLTILGVTVTTNASTAFDDKSSLHIRQFRLSDVRTGDYVEVRGTPAASGGGLVAALLERDNPEQRSYLQGVVTSVANPNFTVLGTGIATDSQTHFVGMGNQSKAAAEFFAQALNQPVRVRGTLNGTVFTADQAQLRH